MATNPTNSTTVNIRNLPTSQLAVDSDYLILQTNNGTQIISFEDFNVVKTDITGNATVIGVLTGTKAIFTDSVMTPTVSASRFWTVGSLGSFYGANLPNNFYDSFTVQNGLVVSGVPTSDNFRSNPMYTSLYTQLTAASANNAARSNRNIYDQFATVIINANNNSNTGLTFNNIPAAITTAPQPANFTVMPTNIASLSTVPFISNISLNSGVVTYNLNAGQTLPGGGSYSVRLMITY
jgi:hypothetical protein